MAFLASDCKPIQASSKQMVVQGQISMNGVRSHPTHTLTITQGCYCCTKCGYYAEKKLDNLKDECHGADARTKHGNLALDDVMLGFTPAKRAGTLVNPSRAVTSKTATSAPGNGVPIGSSFGMTFESIHAGGQASSSMVNQSPPTHDNEDPLNIKELTELNNAGEKVVMPSEVHAKTPLVTSTQSHSTHIATHIPPLKGFYRILKIS